MTKYLKENLKYLPILTPDVNLKKYREKKHKNKLKFTFL